MTTSGCPGCSSRRAKAHEVRGVVTCLGCGGIYTIHRIYLGDSYAIVLPDWHTGPETTPVYYDLDVLGSAGPERRHGWFEPTTRRIVQTG